MMRVMRVRRLLRALKTRSRTQRCSTQRSPSIEFKAVGGFLFSFSRQRHTTSQMRVRRLLRALKTRSRTQRCSIQRSPSITQRGGRVSFFTFKAKTHNKSDARAAVAFGTEKPFPSPQSGARPFILSSIRTNVHVENQSSVLALKPLISKETAAHLIPT